MNCIRVNINDNVVTVIKDVTTDEELEGKGVPGGIKSLSCLNMGHKAAVEEIRSGEKVIKYGEVIGYASQMIKQGEHVHVHNIVSGRGRGDLE
ncbi:MAG: UxaA family hydrolase [Synergistaceae bacterium]|nr:UxaA family hydrolase [Synergistaceae bacterium]